MRPTHLGALPPCFRHAVRRATAEKRRRKAESAKARPRHRLHRGAPHGFRSQHCGSSAVAALSPFHFLRSFERTVHMTPHSFVRGRRLERIRAAVANGEDALEAARRYGFMHIRHFRSQYRRHYGLAPGQDLYDLPQQAERTGRPHVQSGIVEQRGGRAERDGERAGAGSDLTG